MTVKDPVAFQAVDPLTATDMFSARVNEQKWGPLIRSLQTQGAVFVEGMTRSQLESVRSIIAYRHLGKLHSRQREMAGKAGRLLRLGGPVK